MDETQSAAALKSAGEAVHLHDGVWWQQAGPGFCKPVDLLREIVPGAARPALARRWLGYSHAVADAAGANHAWDVMCLEGDGLRQFDLSRVKPKRRRCIKQAQAALQFRLLTDIQPLLPAMNEVNVATARRTGHGRPAEYYLNRRAEWERAMLREFSLAGREWWGAVHEGRLIAYYYVHVACRTLFINAAKSHTDFLHLSPNDGLVFTLLEHHAKAADCDRAIYGDWSPDVPSLNEFKERYGFVRKLVPIFRHESPVLRLALSWKNRRKNSPPPVATLPAAAEQES